MKTIVFQDYFKLGGGGAGVKLYISCRDYFNGGGHDIKNLGSFSTKYEHRIKRFW